MVIEECCSSLRHCETEHPGRGAWMDGREPLPQPAGMTTEQTINHETGAGVVGSAAWGIGSMMQVAIIGPLRPVGIPSGECSTTDSTYDIVCFTLCTP
jgi:hypothetical protein